MTHLPVGDELDRLLAAIQRQNLPELTYERRLIAALGAHMLVFEETSTSERGSKLTSHTVYTRDGAFVGTESRARLLHGLGIAPTRAPESMERCACTIGFSEEQRAWFGWSHRGICGFHVGFEVMPGHVVTAPTEGPNGETVSGFAVGFTATTLDDCKALAIKYAAEIQ